jgi:hypothetical protein
MPLTTFVLRIKDTVDNTYAVGALDLDSRISIEEALDTAMADLVESQQIERITNADTKESLTLQSVTHTSKGFGK